MAFYSLEPFGPQAANLNAGIVASMIGNVNRGKNTQPIKAHEMAQGSFPEYELPPQSVEDHETMIKAIAASSGAKRVKRDKKE